MIEIEFGNFIAKIDPDDGMNVCELKWKNFSIISKDVERCEKGLTYGMPILFPTPNRTANNIFTYNGKQYSAKNHGLIRNRPFTIITENTLQDTCVIEGELNWDYGQEDYDMFPFDFKLTIKIQFSSDEIIYDYKVLNLGNEPLPYGFALHPFFDNDVMDAKIQASSEYVLEAENMLSTGNLIQSRDSEFDLSDFRKVTDLNLDHVYMGEGGQKATVQWENHSMSIEGSDVFSHLVVYTPKNSSRFCIEPQTCSTDAINLFTRGHHMVSGIVEVLPKEISEGTVKFTFA